MNSKLKSALIVILALASVGGGVLAWQQHRALVALQNAQGKTASDNSAALQKRLADAEHRAHDLENKLAALSAGGSGGNPDDAPPVDGAGVRRDRPGRFRGPEAFMAMLSDPKVAQLMNGREKLMLDSRYAALFKSLTQGTSGANLSPEQLDAFKNLLVEKQNTLRDVMMTAHSQGVSDRSEISQLVQSAQADVDTQIQATLGTAGYEQYQQYEQTQPQRAVVSQLSQSLSYTSAPLSDTQSQQLIQILAANADSGSNSNPMRAAMGFGGGPGGLGGGAQITDAAIAQAQSVLTTSQVQALVTLQQQQKAQEDMMQAMRTARQNATQQAPSAGATATSTPAQATPAK